MRTVLELEGESHELKPLNGEKTHPLTKHAIGVLREIAKQPRPRLVINPGVANRLERESLVETVQLPSPYKSHRSGKCPHLRITERGKKALAALSML